MTVASKAFELKEAFVRIAFSGNNSVHYIASLCSNKMNVPRNINESRAPTFQ